jgi:formylglycine-generating enzyme required for sulfatase activity
MDLAGSMWEWALDIQASSFPVEDPCNDCVNLSGSADRAIRGGSWFEGPSYLTTYERLVDPPDSTWHNVGIRCARSP